MFRTFQQAASHNKENGGYPDTFWTIVHLHRNREPLGIAEAFARIGGRNLVDLNRLDALLAAQAPLTPASVAGASPARSAAKKTRPAG